MTLPFLEHKDINNNQKQLHIDLSDFFERTESYIWVDVLPKEGKVKYPCSWRSFLMLLIRANAIKARAYAIKMLV